MLHAFSNADGVFKVSNCDEASLATAIWLDLSNPTLEEKHKVEAVCGVRIDSPVEVDHFYIAKQVRQNNGQLVLKALLLGGIEQKKPVLIPVTIIKTGGPLITVSTGSPDGLSWLVTECQERAPTEPKDVFPAILDMVIDHATNVLEHIGSELDRINSVLFQHHATKRRRLLLSASPARRTAQIEAILTDLGYCREVLVKLRRSVMTFRRLLGLVRERVKDEDLLKKISSFEHELESIAEAQVDMSNGATFMLDGAVGYITILQSKTINIMTILGVLLTPPVLVASVYGMNFKHMPELDWQFGYLWALGLMMLLAAGMYLVTRSRGWL
jgi:magnesium transporter